MASLTKYRSKVIASTVYGIRRALTSVKCGELAMAARAMHYIRAEVGYSIDHKRPPYRRPPIKHSGGYAGALDGLGRMVLIKRSYNNE